MKVANPFCSVSLLSLIIALLGSFQTSHARANVDFTLRSSSLDPKVMGVTTIEKRELELNKVVETRGGAESVVSSEVGGAFIFTLLDIVARKVFAKYDIPFPSQLGGCMILFAAMVMGEQIIPGFGDNIFSALNPGAVLLAKWLPVFFVPGLAMLPLAPSVGSPVEVVKVLAVIIIGFVFSLGSTAFTVLGLRTAMGAVSSTTPDTKKKRARVSNKTKEAPKPPKPFSDETMAFLLKGSVLTGCLSLLSTLTDMDGATPIKTAYFLFVTFATYVWGARLPSGFTKVIHPLVTSTVLTLATMALFGVVTGTTFMDVLKTYKVGSMDPLEAGAGDILLYLLGPSVVSFAMPMYGRKKLLKENLLPVSMAALVSSAGGLFGTGLFARLIQLGGSSDNFLRRSVLTRNVTTALAIVITAILEGDLAICSSVVVLTGIIGATYGRSLLTAMGINDPISRGLGIGASGQGLGVASISSEKDAFPFAAMSMVLTAVSATVLVSIPSVKEALINVIGGAAKVVPTVAN